MLRKLVFPVALFLIAFGLTFALCGMGSIGMLIDAPTLALVIPLPFILAAFPFGFKAVCRSFVAPFEQSDIVEVDTVDQSLARDLRVAVAYFTAVRSAMWAMCALLIGIGAIASLSNLQDKANIGQNLAIVLTSVVTAAFGNLVFVLPFRNAASARLASLD